MGIGSETRGLSAARWCPRLFLVGGVLLLGHAALLAIDTFTAVTTPPDVSAPTAHLLAVLGLLGLVGVYGGRWRRPLRALVLLTVVGWAGITALQFGSLVGVAPEGAALPPVAAVALLFLTALAYGLVALVGYRTGDHQSVVDLLVATPAALLVALLVNGAALGAPPVGTLLVATGLGLAQLGLGTTLRHWGPTTRGLAAPGAVGG